MNTKCLLVESKVMTCEKYLATMRTNLFGMRDNSNLIIFILVSFII